MISDLATMMRMTDCKSSLVETNVLLSIAAVATCTRLCLSNSLHTRSRAFDKETELTHQQTLETSNGLLLSACRYLA